MKSDDLFTKLHDQYNTLPSAILDSQAFHHDVLEISTEASTPEEFHRLMARRKQQRLSELNEGLESASVEIIANPALIGTPQWEYALQLFRARSLDALVRYFSSYLASDNSSLDSNSIRYASSTSSTTSTVATDVDNGDFPSFFPHHHEKPLITHEPEPISTVDAQLPPSPRSIDAGSPVASHSDDDDADPDPYVINTLTPARSLSFSGSESDRFFAPEPSRHFDEDDAGRPLDPETPSTSASDEPDVDDLIEASGPQQFVVDSREREPRSDSRYSTISHPNNTAEHPVTIPRPENESSLLSELSQSMISRTRRLPSPPHTQHDATRKSPRLCRRELSPGQAIRRSPGASLGRVQKPAMEQARVRPVCRRRPD